MTAALTDRPVVESAPAKINLYLHVLGRREDGYHDLDSLAAFVDIGDELRLAPAPTLTLRVDGPFAPALAGEAPSDNLVWRAAVLLAEHCYRAAAAAIHLDKRLPVASGIGGGSSDAAACLRGLARLWGLPDRSAAVMAVAERLGSDVPVCVAARTSYFGGRGERLDPAPPLPPVAVVLANPGLPLATPAVFRSRRGDFSAMARLDDWPGTAEALATALAARRNDLAAAAISIMPPIAGVLAALADTGGCLLARLSGSGPTCFGIFASDRDAVAAADSIGAQNPAWWVRAGRFL